MLHDVRLSITSKAGDSQFDHSSEVAIVASSSSIIVSGITRHGGSISNTGMLLPLTMLPLLLPPCDITATRMMLLLLPIDKNSSKSLNNNSSESLNNNSNKRLTLIKVEENITLRHTKMTSHHH